MGEEVHPLAYLLHALFFVWGAVLLGLFLHELQKEITLNGWVLSPRCFWCWCLCVSSLTMVCLHFDPYGALGIYSPTWLKLFQVVSSEFLLDCFACALYLYLIVLYRQHLSSVPKQLFYIWAGINASATGLMVLVSALGSATNNAFWFAVATLILMVQESMTAILVNVSLARIEIVLLKMAQRGSGLASIYGARRKIWVVRVVTVVLVCLALGNQCFGPDNFISKLVWGVPVPPYQTSRVQNLPLLGASLVCVAHMLLLYTLRRPQNSDENTKVERIDVSSQHSTSERAVNVV